MGARAQAHLADHWPRATREWITGQLARLLARGAYAKVLYKDAPELVDVLCPPDKNPGLNESERIEKAESMIRAAIEEVDRDYFEDVKEALLRRFALREGLGLKGGPKGKGQEAAARRRRRDLAGKAIGLEGRTFERNYQDQYIEELAEKLYRLIPQ
jgi:hypothetical protein